jgi:deazaflavin-dependent oxidoreductase (nitroreductase family)
MSETAKNVMAEIKPPPRVTAFNKILLGLQVFMLRRGWMGDADKILMVITTTGRKSGKKFSTPIGYLRDGDDVIALTTEGSTNWWRNAVANGKATLEIQGDKFDAVISVVNDEAERQRIFALYKKDLKYFKINFRVELNAPEDEQQAALKSRTFMQFKRV